jgi:hypothetical protein
VIDEPTIAELRATDATAATLTTLRQNPHAVAIVARLDQARAAAQLMHPEDPLTGALHRLLDAIERCHSAGRSDSPEMRHALFEALVALYADKLRRRR